MPLDTGWKPRGALGGLEYYNQSREQQQSSDLNQAGAWADLNRKLEELDDYMYERKERRLKSDLAVETHSGAKPYERTRSGLASQTEISKYQDMKAVRDEVTRVGKGLSLLDAEIASAHAEGDTAAAAALIKKRGRMAAELNAAQNRYAVYAPDAATVTTGTRSDTGAYSYAQRGGTGGVAAEYTTPGAEAISDAKRKGASKMTTEGTVPQEALAKTTPLLDAHYTNTGKDLGWDADHFKNMSASAISTQTNQFMEYLQTQKIDLRDLGINEDIAQNTVANAIMTSLANYDTKEDQEAFLANATAVATMPFAMLQQQELPRVVKELSMAAADPNLDEANYFSLVNRADAIVSMIDMYSRNLQLGEAVANSPAFQEGKSVLKAHNTVKELSSRVLGTVGRDSAESKKRQAYVSKALISDREAREAFKGNDAARQGSYFGVSYLDYIDQHPEEFSVFPMSKDDAKVLTDIFTSPSKTAEQMELTAQALRVFNSMQTRGAPGRARHAHLRQADAEAKRMYKDILDKLRKGTQ